LSERYPEFKFQLLAINERGHSSDIPIAVEGRDLPLLQDDNWSLAWDNWGATWRDVMVLDGENEIVGIINLTGNSLGETENRAELEALLLEAGGISP